MGGPCPLGRPSNRAGGPEPESAATWTDGSERDEARAALRRPCAARRAARSLGRRRGAGSAGARALPGQEDLVAAARTVLVVLDRPPSATDDACSGTSPSIRPWRGPGPRRSTSLSCSTGPTSPRSRRSPAGRSRQWSRRSRRPGSRQPSSVSHPASPTSPGCRRSCRSPAGDPAHARPGGGGRPGRTVRGRVSAGLARRLAAGRPHRRRPVRRGP